MTPILLTNRQRAELEGALLGSSAARECCRAQALLWLTEGWTVEEIADLLRVSRQTIYNWVNRFQQRGDRDLPDRLGDAPRSGRPKAGDGDIDRLIDEVVDSDPRARGYRATVWTAPLLSRYLREHHQIIACDRTVGRAIDRLGIRWERPRHQLARRPDSWRQAKGGSNAGSRAAVAPCS